MRLEEDEEVENENEEGGEEADQESLNQTLEVVKKLHWIVKIMQLNFNAKMIHHMITI